MRQILRVFLCLLLCAVPIRSSAQQSEATLADSVRSERPPSDRQLRQRAGYGVSRVDGAIADLQALRSHVEQLRAGLHSRVTADSLGEIPGPPVVLDWRTGEWQMRVGGYLGILDIEKSTATVAGVTAPVDVTFAGDTLRLSLAVPGYAAGAVEVVHAEGRLLGTVTLGAESRPASGERPTLAVVRVVDADPCAFAEFTDGSWGVAPNTGACHQALDSYAGPMRYVARDHTP